MKQLLRTVAGIISLLALTFANIVPIEPNGNEDYVGDCGDYTLNLYYPSSIVLQKYSISLRMLRCLIIRGSGIRNAVDGAFDEMPNLWYLNLQGNSIPPGNLFSFGNISSVRKLILGNQKWGSNTKPVVITGIYPELEYLDLKNNGISNIQNPWTNPFPELTYLDLSGNSIGNFSVMHSWASKLTYLNLNNTGISQFSFARYSHLMSLVLDNNNIRFIGGNALDVVGATNLENLSLAGNQIRSIRYGAFRDSAKLRYLDMSMNLLSTINPGTLEDLHSLHTLILDQNSFEDLSIALPPNITFLSVNCNSIKYLTISSLYNLQQLKTLSLTGNKIVNVHTDAFQNQEMLEELYLNNNELSYLPTEWCEPMKNLRYLDLSGNEFSTFDATIRCSVPSLQYIHVEHNPVTFINASTFATLSENVTVYLESDLSRANVTYCTESAWGNCFRLSGINDNKISKISLGLPNLTSLVLDNNNIETIGDNGLDLVGLPNLKSLSVANNRISSIRKAAFRDTVSLRHLNISMNSLSTIYPETLKDLHSLQVLVLDQNSFEDVPIAVPLNIMTLSMNCNRIKFLTVNSLYNLPQLKTLSLTGNMISSVHTDAFQNQKMLEKLYLNSNELSHLPNGWYKSMKGLRYLDLSNNQFTLLESVFQTNLPSLQQLYFELNPIKYINGSTFGTFSKYVTVYLDAQSNRTTEKCQPHPSYQTTTTTRSFEYYDRISDDNDHIDDY